MVGDILWIMVSFLSEETMIDLIVIGKRSYYGVMLD